MMVGVWLEESGDITEQAWQSLGRHLWFDDEPRWVAEDDLKPARPYARRDDLLRSVSARALMVTASP